MKNQFINGFEAGGTWIEILNKRKKTGTKINKFEKLIFRN